jgi:hypothetical protein
MKEERAGGMQEVAALGIVWSLPIWKEQALCQASVS